MHANRDGVWDMISQLILGPLEREPTLVATRFALISFVHSIWDDGPRIRSTPRTNVSLLLAGLGKEREEMDIRYPRPVHAWS